jgi:hypothetical protein
MIGLRDRERRGDQLAAPSLQCLGRCPVVGIVGVSGAVENAGVDD